MVVSNVFELDIYRKNLDKNSSKLLMNLNNVIKYMKLIFLSSLKHELSNEFKDLKVDVEFEVMDRCENSLTEDKPPTFLIVLRTEVEGIWTDLALSSNFKLIINAHLWYAKEMLMQESILYEEEYSYSVMSADSCLLCKDKHGSTCKSETKYKGKDGPLLANLNGRCIDFRYDKTKSKHRNFNQRITLKDHQRFNAMVIFNLNKMTGLRLMQDYVVRHLIEIQVEEV